MKFFSLETKKHLVLWAVVCSFIIIPILRLVVMPDICLGPGVFTLPDGTNNFIPCYLFEGPYSIVSDKFVVSIFLIILIILLAIRHFRKKQNLVEKNELVR